MDTTEIRKRQAMRQMAHWSNAIDRLSSIEELAGAEAWSGLDTYLNSSIKYGLEQTVQNLQRKARRLNAEVQRINSVAAARRMHEEILKLKQEYLRTEFTLDFFADAINTRTSKDVSAMLRACDYMAKLSMQEVLAAANVKTPPVLTYIDKGLGASILKAGLRLWDGNLKNPVAAIKIVRHNLLRPTSLIHESGHQVAHYLGWNEELKQLLHKELSMHSEELSDVWSAWSSEIAADVFAFVNTGYASVVALQDVVSGSDKAVFRYSFADPHPVSFLRVLLGTALCRLVFGKGHWDELEYLWIKEHQLHEAQRSLQSLIMQSYKMMPLIARLCLGSKLKSLNNRAIASIIDPGKNSPSKLQALESSLGPSLVNSPYWVKSESLRLLALTGYKLAVMPQEADSFLRAQKNWMKTLGNNYKTKLINHVY